MKIRKICWIVLLLSFISFELNAQYQLVGFQKNMFEFTLEDLEGVNLISTSEKLVNLELKITDQSSEVIFNERFVSFQINIGNNFVFRNINLNSFSKTSFTGQYFSNNHKVTRGGLNVCVIINPVQGEPIPDFQCNNFVIIEPTPIYLTTPKNQEILKTKQPTFEWIGVMPEVKNSSYEIKIVQLSENQDPAEAIAINTPLVYEKNIFFNFFNYSTIFPLLQEDIKYCWQVIEYSNNTEVSRSEIWTFQIGKEPLINSNDQFLVLDQISGQVNISIKDKIRFALTHLGKEKKMNYSLFNLTENKEMKISKVVKLTDGKNYIEIDPKELQLKKNNKYKLTINETQSFTYFFIYE